MNNNIGLRNAFNSACWQFSLEELPTTLLEVESAHKIVKTTSGVPQGFIVGQISWNT